MLILRHYKLSRKNENRKKCRALATRSSVNSKKISTILADVCGWVLDRRQNPEVLLLPHLLVMCTVSVVVSYECDNYVLNDNTAGDVKILRNCLQTQSSNEETSCRRSSRLRRSCSTAVLTRSLAQFVGLLFLFALTLLPFCSPYCHYVDGVMSRWQKCNCSNEIPHALSTVIVVIESLINLLIVAIFDPNLP